MRIVLLVIFLFVVNCKFNKIVDSHGSHYLEKKEKELTINISNKNDTIKVLGQPATKGMTNNNVWIYIERTKTRGKLLKLGKDYLKKNNVLVLEFDKYGILSKKDFYNKEDMKKINFTKKVTVNEIRKENFIKSFLSSVRQKMQTRRK